MSGWRRDRSIKTIRTLLVRKKGSREKRRSSKSRVIKTSRQHRTKRSRCHRLRHLSLGLWPQSLCQHLHRQNLQASRACLYVLWHNKPCGDLALRHLRHPCMSPNSRSQILPSLTSRQRRHWKFGETLRLAAVRQGTRSVVRVAVQLPHSGVSLGRLGGRKRWTGRCALSVTSCGHCRGLRGSCDG